MANTERRESFVYRISAIYLLLTLINLIIFWVVTGSNQMELITKKALLESGNVAYQTIRRLQPILRRRPSNQAILMKRVSAAIAAGDEKLLDRFRLITSSGEVITENATATKEEIRQVHKALQLREQKGLEYVLEPDILSYTVKTIIPIDLREGRELVLMTTLQLASVKAELGALIKLGITMVVLLLFIQALFGLILYRSVIQPLQRLVKGATKVTGGDLSVTVRPTKRKDEIAQLIETFNHMVGSIKDRSKKLENANKLLENKDKIVQLELNMAEGIQQGLMPSVRELRDDLRMAVYYAPLEKISGDYYDVFNLKAKSTGILVADAAGHGIPAALITIMAKFHFSSLASRYTDPADLFTRVNTALFHSIVTPEYLTACYLVVRPDLSIEYSNGAHTVPVVVRADGKLEELPGKGFMIGSLERLPFPFETHKARLKPGDRVLLYTDGIIEAESKKGESYGFTRFKQSIRKHRKLPISEMKDRMIEDVDKFSKGKERFDDYTIVIVEAGLEKKKPAAKKKSQ